MYKKDIKSKPLLINPPPYLSHLLLQQKINIERLTKDKRSTWRAYGGERPGGWRSRDAFLIYLEI